MSAELALTPSFIYQIPESFFRIPILSVIPRRDEEVDREDILLRKLGSRARDRMCLFRDYYSTYWGENGTGKPMSQRAYEALCRFVEHMSFPAGRDPSIFLTDAGNLELCWEEAAGGSIQIEFTPDRAEYYVQSRKSESFAEFGNLGKLAEQLARL
jgi:hypothetical protein